MLLPIGIPAGTYRYTVSNSVGSIQGKVTLYVTSEMNGWGRQRGRGLELPKVISCPVTVEQFPQYMEEKRANSSRFLRDQFLVSHCYCLQATRSMLGTPTALGSPECVGHTHTASVYYYIHAVSE